MESDGSTAGGSGAIHEVELGDETLPLAGSKPKSVVQEAFTSASFIEKVALLFLTMVLSGLLVPLLIGHFNTLAAVRQRDIESLRAKEEAIRQAQFKLLDEFSETIITYGTLALDVSYYRLSEAKNEDLHRRAFERYSERVVDLVSKWRILASRAQTLASPKISGKINSFLNRIFVEQDTPLNQLYRDKATEAQWKERHEKSGRMLVEANALILELALDMGLSREHLHK